MKPERRHELQENSLAKGIVALPSFWNRHGSKVLLAIIGVALVIILINYRNASAKRAEESARASLADVRTLLDDMKTQELQQMPQENLAQFRSTFATQAGSALGAIINQAKASGDDALLADVTVTRGDLNWMLANLPELPGATTRPTLKLEQPSSAYLQSAQDAYQEVLNQKSAPLMQKNQARFGLAAVAENKADWTLAEKTYQAIADDAATIEAYKSLAQTRLSMLPQLKSGVLLAKPTTVPTVAQPVTTQPATTQSVG